MQDTTPRNNMFFTYRQNNSGGVWDGPEAIVVEAEDTDEANAIAQLHGVYFDGLDTGKDCPCCGPRWTRAWDGHENPFDEVDSATVIYKEK